MVGARMLDWAMWSRSGGKQIDRSKRSVGLLGLRKDAGRGKTPDCWGYYGSLMQRANREVKEK